MDLPSSYFSPNYVTFVAANPRTTVKLQSAMNNPRSSQTPDLRNYARHSTLSGLNCLQTAARSSIVTRDATSTVDSVKVATAEALASVLRGSCDAGDPKFGSGSDF